MRSARLHHQSPLTHDVGSHHYGDLVLLHFLNIFRSSWSGCALLHDILLVIGLDTSLDLAISEDQKARTSLRLASNNLSDVQGERR